MLVQLVDDTKNVVVAAINGTDDILTALRNAVVHQVSGLAKDAVSMTGSLADIAEGSVEAAVEVGADVGKAAVSVVEGSMEAAGFMGVSGAEAAEAALTGVLRAANKVGGETLNTVKSTLSSTASLPAEVVKKVLG